MITVIFLVFILVQGCVVCDDLYPISVLRGLGVIENHVEGSSHTNKTIEVRVLPRKSNVLTNTNIKWIQEHIVQWIQKHIVQEYGFDMDSKNIEWKEGVGQPTFENELGTTTMRDTAKIVEEFFKNNNDWRTTKAKFSPIDVLYLTAARYLLVTEILYRQSPGYRLIPCVKFSDGRYQIPIQGVCYPVPYGSARWSSDYDVGLIGMFSGDVAKNFNQYFEKTFKRPSELVFDTNVYAFTLEYSMPFIFVGLPEDFVKGVAEREKTEDFKMQELASAYYKVFKYNEVFFGNFKTEAYNAMDFKATQSKIELDKWLKIFSDLNNQVKLRLEDFESLLEFRREHNRVYQDMVEKMSQTIQAKGYQADLLGDLAKSLFYAAEAYHTRGAMRHVVGGTQMKVTAISPNIRLKKRLSTYDLWVSMIENWGESNKEYNHCKDAPLKECFMKMSKYMWRMFNAMTLIRDRIPATYRPGLVHFGEAYADPEYAMRMWLAYKKKGKVEIDQEKQVKEFLRQFHCDGAVSNINMKFPLECLSKMSDAVNLYNVKLAKLLTDKSDQEPWMDY